MNLNRNSRLKMSFKIGVIKNAQNLKEDSSKFGSESHLNKVAGLLHGTY